uniref:Putative heat shock transcription factor hsf n=1 Tax=Anopheles darlingi TaxID=43151 RepID=A0A2M4CIF7_ANODA
MNLPDMMTDEQQLQQLSGAGSSSSNSNEKSNTSSSPTPGGGDLSALQTQLMAYKLGMNGGNPPLGLMNGIIGGSGGNFNGNGSSLCGPLHGNGNGSAILGGNGLIGPDGTIVTGDYVDLNELLNMDGHGSYHDDDKSLAA